MIPYQILRIIICHSQNSDRRQKIRITRSYLHLKDKHMQFDVLSFLFQFEYRDAVDRVDDVPTLYPADDDDDKYKKKKTEKLSTW